MMACSVFYYFDTIIDFMGWPNPQWGIFYTVHDLHRLLFLIPVFYAARAFRLRGAIVTALITMLVFLPRAIFIAPYPDALLRPIIFFISLGIMGVLIALQFDAIEDRKVKEQLIRESKEFLVSVLDSLSYPFYVLDVNDYRIKLMNQAVNKGNLSENLTCYALTHHREEPCIGPGHPCPLKEIQKTKKPVVTEHIHYDEHGSARHVEVHGYPIFDSEGSVIQMIEYCLDITERKRAEEALHESEERYRALVNLGAQTGEAVVMLQDDERGVGMHVFASEAWSHVTGYSTEELLNMSMADLIHPRDREAAVERHNRRIRGEELPGFYESNIIRKDGTEVPVEVTYAFSNYKGQRVNVGFIRDITERKQAEEKRIQLIQELQETLKEVRTLSGLLPICAWCKKLRDDEGYWKSVEQYIGERTKAKFTHGMCPECQSKFLSERNSNTKVS
ncbi:hypothetical protein ES707_04709 [subsurface metagenome]